MKSRYFVALTVATLLTAPITAQSEESPNKSTSIQLVDALNDVFGEHHARAVHAKGAILEGTFTPSKLAASVSKAAHLQTKTIPVMVRFSNFAGIPSIADNDGHASPRGMAIKFKLPNGSDSDIIAHSFNGFPSPTADDFRDLLSAIGSSGASVAKPTPLDSYLDSHPIAKAFLTIPKPNPLSFGSLPYFGVNSFKFTNAKGVDTFGRYQLIPVDVERYLTDAESLKASANYLIEEVALHVSKTPIKFRLVLQIADQGDNVKDPSVAWPDSRKKIELGVISMTKALPADDAADKKLVFIPANVPIGIEPADPMIHARSGAYSASFSRRQ